MGDLSVLAGPTILRGGVSECQPRRRNWSLRGPWHFVQPAAGERDPERALPGYGQYGERILRGLPPRRRAQQVINWCAHPDYRPALQDYLDGTAATGPGKHTAYLLGAALLWHVRYLHEGTMGPG